MRCYGVFSVAHHYTSIDDWLKKCTRGSSSSMNMYTNTHDKTIYYAMNFHTVIQT